MPFLAYCTNVQFILLHCHSFYFIVVLNFIFNWFFVGLFYLLTSTKFSFIRSHSFKSRYRDEAAGLHGIKKCDCSLVVGLSFPLNIVWQTWKTNNVWLLDLCLVFCFCCFIVVVVYDENEPTKKRKNKPPDKNLP